MMADEKKFAALEAFKSQLLKSEVADKIAKLILHGSLVHGTASRDSDIDVLVIAFDHWKDIQTICSDLSFEIMLDSNEKIEAFVYSYFDYQYPRSYFLYLAKQKGKEIYSMSEEQIKRQEARQLMDLASSYLAGAIKNLKMGEFRIAIDAQNRESSGNSRKHRQNFWRGVCKTQYRGQATGTKSQ
ncbi:MAG: nucleotidyltransferase domain-containing protein [candidate division KSB1 bacterium]|nr:nucleotidyltransferase domain-containing protein [candidate division KSB1 bacterium]